MPLAARVRTSIQAASLVALTAMTHGVLYGRWMIVVAALFMLAGTAVAWRARTLGVGLALAAASAFPAAHLLGIGPSWFWLVGAGGALPFVMSWRPMAFFDRQAAVLFGALAVAAGAAGAFACSALS